MADEMMEGLAQVFYIGAMQTTAPSTPSSHWWRLLKLLELVVCSALEFLELLCGKAWRKVASWAVGSEALIMRSSGQE